MAQRNNLMQATVILVATAVLAACSKEAGGPPPPPEVGVITLAPRDEGNLVVVALKGPPLRVDRHELFDRADLVKARYGLPARGWAKTIRASL